MKKALFAAALGMIVSSNSLADNVTYTFEDNDMDEVFNVSIEVENGSTFGLATYNVQLEGLVAAGIDASLISWAEGTLADGATGFTDGLLQGVVGGTTPAADAFSAFNSQFENTAALTGVGQTAVSSGAINLGVPALLGTLTVPGANGLSDSDLEALFAPSAALFSRDTNLGADFDTLVEDPTGIMSVLERAAAGIPGDFDNDGDVDGVDLGVFAFDFANSPQGGPPFAQADFDEDGDVDGVDLGVFSFSFANFPPSATAVPEPSTVLLGGLALVGFAVRRR